MLLLVNHITWSTVKALKITSYSNGVEAMWRVLSRYLRLSHLDLPQNWPLSWP